MNWEIARWIDIYAGIPLAYLMLCFKKAFRNAKKTGARDNYRKILLVKFWGIGNIIMLLPSAHALKRKYPDAALDIWTLHSNSEVSKITDTFRNVYTINTETFFDFIKTYLKNFIRLKARDYDLIIDFEQFSRFSSISCILIGRKKTIGFTTRGQHRGFLYTDPVIYNDDIHTMNSFCTLVESIGITDIKHPCPISITFQADEISKMRELLRNSGLNDEGAAVLLHVGTSNNCNFRHWPTEYFAKLADKLIENFKANVIFTGLREENHLVKNVISHMRNKKGVINTSGVLTLRQLFVLVKLSDLIVSADTAPVHIASCLGVPVAGVYGPNTPRLYGPWGDKNIRFYKALDCSPCITNYNAKINKCRHPLGQGSCMKQISSDEVFLGIKNNYFDKISDFKLEKQNELIYPSKKYNSQ